MPSDDARGCAPLPAETDVLVLGAGPAGCAAAIRARRVGLRVTVLEGRPRTPRAPGETLHPGIEPLFGELGVLAAVHGAGFHRHAGLWLEDGAARRFVPYGAGPGGRWLGFHADRQRLGTILQAAATQAQATLLKGARPQALLVEHGRVCGVMLDGRPLRAAWTLDATGRQAWLAQQRGLAVRRLSPRLVARFGWREGEELQGGDGDAADPPLFRFRPDGWDWRAPLGMQRTAWVTLRIGDARAPRTGGLDMTWTSRPDCAGPGYFLLGDAACLFDPSSSHGVLRALMSGLLAAHLIDGCVKRGAAEAGVVDAYRSWMAQQQEADERRLRACYSGSIAAASFAAH